MVKKNKIINMSANYRELGLADVLQMLCEGHMGTALTRVKTDHDSRGRQWSRVYKASADGQNHELIVKANYDGELKSIGFEAGGEEYILRSTDNLTENPVLEGIAGKCFGPFYIGKGAEFAADVQDVLIALAATSVLFAYRDQRRAA